MYCGGSGGEAGEDERELKGQIMGTTFLNLQINRKIEDIPAEAVPQGYFCKQTAENWTAVFAENRETAWDKLPALGKKLSKALAVSVIAVDFFDDDVFSMTLFRDGRAVGTYHTEAARSQISGSEKWIKALSLSGEAAAAFRYLTKKEMTAGESIHAFSRLLGARLYDAPGLTKEDAALWRADTDGIVREMKEEKKKKQSPNGTKAVLLQEIPGLYDSCDYRTGVVRMVYPDDKDGFDYRHIHCLACTETGLTEVHDYRYPASVFGKDCKGLQLDYDNRIVHVMVLDSPIYYEDYDLNTYEAELCALSAIPKEKLLKNAFVSMFPLQRDSTLRSGRYEYFTWNGGNELQKIDRETSGKAFLQRNIIASYQYEPLDFQKEFWSHNDRSVCASRNGIVHVRLKYIREPENTVCDIRFFDRDLKLLRQEEIFLNEPRFALGESMGYAYCEESDCIYLGNLKINLQTHEVKIGAAELKDAAVLLINPNECGGRLYAVKGSWLSVFDLNMEPVSSHRLKGRILAGYRNKRGRLCLMTAEDFLWDYRRPKKASAVRVYEITE
ncbi:MAG: hypothetical protein HDR11_12485 [Lachnospiraceae bacterium]|nr:hypothetical protein [Lachnospiraceae bacterium]